MRKQKHVKLLSILLVFVIAFGTFAPAVHAQELDSTYESSHSEEGTGEEGTGEEGTGEEGTGEEGTGEEGTGEEGTGEEGTGEEGTGEEGTGEEGTGEEGTGEGTGTSEEPSASGESATGGTSTDEAPAADDTERIERANSVLDETEAALEEAVLPAADYDTFLSSLKTLEGYASDYAQANNENAAALVLNYIRTGIDKYNDDSWAILAGAENTAFTAYVAEQDAANSTSAQALRGINCFTVPNGQEAEFAHLIGVMSIANYNNNASTSADFGGWAGDLVDLMEYSKGKVTATEIEAMADEIRENYLGVDAEDSHSFGFLDIYADLDAVYLMSQLNSGITLSAAMEGYFTADLTDTDRAVYFLTKRFEGNTTQDELRSVMLQTYSENSGVIMLEAERNLTNDNDLRTACCYAFTDYLYELAKDELGGETEQSYYEVFSSEKSTLAPGITQEIKKAITTDEKQIVYYIATADVKRDDVSIFANYKDNAGGPPWGMSRVTDQMAAAQANHTNPDDPENYIENYTPIVGVNADFYNMTTGCPSGALVMEGVEYHPGYAENFFAILKDGTPMIGTGSEWDTYKDQIQEAVGGASYLVKDGEIAVSATSDYYSSRASRTCVGITADGQVVLMVLDGRQEPFSAGGAFIEIAQIMLEAGCVTAINLDGGGSTTYAAKEEGSDEVAVVNRPSDGYERSVSSSLMVVSTAKSSNEFDHAIVTTDADYLTVGTSLDVTVSGVSSSGNTAEIPDGAMLRVSDESIAAITDGVFTATALGDVNIELIIGETVVGSKTLHIVNPDDLAFTKATMNAVYGIEAQLPIVAYYQGNPVSINSADVSFVLSNSNAGTVTDFVFVGNEASGIRTVTITAALTGNTAVTAEMQIALYKDGEAIFDFGNAMEGDSSFAWNRYISNAATDDNVTYTVSDPNEQIDISYVFAIDMQSIQIPEKIKPLIGLLPGGDDPSATAWDFLLQLAERVSVLTEVKVTLQVDPNLTVETSEMTLVNEYFELTSAEFDQGSGLLTVICKWKDQTAAIDPTTANPICILSGVKAFVKNEAQWDENNCMQVINKGDVSYDIYLRSGTLYNVASDSSIQEQYGIYPFINPDDTSETGGHFYETYKTFEDSFTLDNSVRDGWIESGDNLYYYVDNVPVTGVQYLPGYQDEEKNYYYKFDEEGVCQGKVTGLFELDGDLYYAVNGKEITGWRIITVDGKDQYYYFDPETGKAVDGEQTIHGFDYTFTEHILTRGALVHDASGSHYKWAGEWVMNGWVEIDGNKYYAGNAPYGYFVTSMKLRLYKYGSNTEMGYCLFDENGVWQENFSGLYTDEDNNTYLIENGYLVEGAGLVRLDGDYYYFRSSSSTAVKGRAYWITVTNDLLPAGQYTFDDDGKMINPPEVDPDPEPKDGIVEEDGSLYYYVDGVRTGAGLIKIGDDYYYVRSSNGEVIHGRTYWVTSTNDLLPSGPYEFAEDGKMLNPPAVDPDPEPKDGIVEEDGSLYYYVDGVRTGAGLVQIGEDFYYVRTSTGEVIHGRSYWVTATNGLLPAGQYTFADDGKMVR